MTLLTDGYNSSLTCSESDISTSLQGCESLTSIITWGTIEDMLDTIKKLIGLIPANEEDVEGRLGAVTSYQNK